jgi:hypothetical protein
MHNGSISPQRTQRPRSDARVREDTRGRETSDFFIFQGERLLRCEGVVSNADAQQTALTPSKKTKKKMLERVGSFVDAGIALWPLCSLWCDRLQVEDPCC